MSAPTDHPASVVPAARANGERPTDGDSSKRDAAPEASAATSSEGTPIPATPAWTRARDRARTRATARERARERIRALQAAVESVRQLELADERPGEAVGTDGADFERVEALLGRAGVGPDPRPAPDRAEIEGWVREEIGKAERRLGRDVESAREELRGSLAGLVDGALAGRIEAAEAAAEHRLRGRALEFRTWAEQAHARAEERISEMQREPSRRERRHELKLARQERDRRIAAAERRLTARGEELAKQLEQQAAEAERRIRAIQIEVERRLDEVAEGAASAKARQPVELATPR
jgi:hypothetical protein